MSKSKTPVLISEHLRIERRYARSVWIERDLKDAGALSGYVVTPAVHDALARLITGLRPNSSQRAWCVTGAYGSGKSALGLFISHLLGEGPMALQASKLLASTSPDLARAWKRAPRLLPVVVTGAREAFGQTLAQAMLRTMGAVVAKGRPPALIADLEAFAKQHAVGKIPEGRVIELLKRFVQFMATKQYGILLIVDEMGKLLEFAALHPEEADIYTFQQVAEMASGASDAPLAVLGILHQRFADYAEQLGRSLESDWGKVAGRFEEIVFEESLEQFAFLLAAALRLPVNVLAASGIIPVARDLYGRAMQRHELPAASRDATLASMGEGLYPLHPTTVTMLCTGMKRFAQGERSVFNFVASEEPYGLRAFAAKSEISPGTWYRLPNLYDYFAHGAPLRFRTADQRRRWEGLQETLAGDDDLSPREVEVLKSAGLVGILGPLPGLTATGPALAFALADAERDDSLATAIERLVKKGLLFKRASGELALWQRSSIDLGAQYEEASRQLRESGDVAAFAELLPKPRPMIAHRHYHTKGTLRAFRVAYSTLESAEKLRAFSEMRLDGEVLVVLIPPTTKLTEAAKRLTGIETLQDPRRLVCVRQLTREDIAAFEEVRRWEWVRQNCIELRVDRHAASEIDTRMTHLSAAISARVERLVRSPGASGGGIWLYQRSKVEIASDRELSQKLSDICDQVFAKAPIVRNELINRHQISSAVALARFRLVEAMLTKGAQPRLGIEGFPPEYAIYASVLEKSGLHNAGGTLLFAAPPKNDPCHWKATWKTLEKLLAPGGSVSFETILAELARPPLGLRNGPALIFLMAFVLARPREVGIFERGTFVTEFSVEHFQRATKGLKHFAVHYFPAQDQSAAALHAYTSALRDVGFDVAKPDDFAEAAKVFYRWHRQLSPYSHATADVSTDAAKLRTILGKSQDPLELLFIAIPTAFGFPSVKDLDPEGMVGFGTRLSSAVENLHRANERLREKIGAALRDAFQDDGSISDLRTRLRMRGAAFSKELVDYRLKSFIERASDDSLAEAKWLDSMASLLTSKSITNWTDQDYQGFCAEAKARAGQLERWMTLLLDRSSNRDALKDLLGLFVTNAAGSEQQLLVDRTRSVDAHRDEIRKRALELAGDHPMRAAQLLAQVLSTLLEETALNDNNKDAKNGRKAR